MAIMKDSQLDTNVWAFGGMTPSELIDKPLGREGAEEKEGRRMNLVIQREQEEARRGLGNSWSGGKDGGGGKGGNLSLG